MKTITTTTNVYSFSELSEDAKQNVINNFSDINVNYDWWDFTYEEAEELGIEIKGFDVDRGSYCKVTVSDVDYSANKIVSEHGDTCGTYAVALEYNTAKKRILAEAAKDENGDFEDESAIDELLDDAAEDFKRAISEEYLSILRKEYEYQTSREAIIETIEANNYEFTEDGGLF